MSKKVMYDENEFATMKTLLRQIQVIGDQQAAILAMLGQTVRSGKVVEEEPKEPAPATLDLETLVEQLRQSPELANTLAALLSAAPGGR